PPVKLLLNGQPVFLCCKGCEKEAREHSDRTLARVERLKVGTKQAAQAGAPRKPQAAADGQSRGQRDPEVEAALAKLGPTDRRLAEAQKFCVVQGGNLLGSMGTPVKVLIQGQPVFLCCESCVDEARAHPQPTLAKVRE